MKTTSLITRVVVATALLGAVAVPAANAFSDNVPNYGNSGKTVADPSPAGGQGNGNGVGRPDGWGGCRGIHGGDNPGQGLANGLNGGNGGGNGNAYGHDKPWKDCGAGDEEVEGVSYSLPVTR